MLSEGTTAPDARLAELRPHIAHWELVKDVIDQEIDLLLNLRQSGHPGGSRSKVHAMVVTLLGGVMRWDLRAPWKPFGDRFVLAAGHTTPMLYATLSVLTEVLAEAHRRSGDPRYAIPEDRFCVRLDDLLNFRHREGLPGHAEFEGKTLFVKANTGPTGHGLPNALGQAMALKRAGAEEVKVVAFEGEGGLTAGGTYETRNSAYGLGLSNLCLVLDWNDHGIDSRPLSSVVHGTPDDWFRPYGWRVSGTMQGMEWEEVARALLDMAHGPNPEGAPRVCWLRTRKGRGYGIYDYKSHGTPHAQNSELFWETKREFAEKYGIEFEGFGKPAPEAGADRRRQTATNMRRALDVLFANDAAVEYVADRLADLGDSVPDRIPTFKLDPARNPWNDPALADFANYPPEIYIKPGTKAPNRQGFASFGAWVNAYCRKQYGRPLFLVCSADLADSTNISGFAKTFGETPGYGWYDRKEGLDGVLLPQEITEFANSALVAGIASVNMAADPFREYNGFFAACSTYGSFSYLKYGPMRLFSQLAQDCQLKVGKVLWVAGHSGPETAEDARTHFGIFSPGVTQLFPRGAVVNLHPWEANEVPVMLGAALRHPAPIMALHLTRPAIEIPDRAALGIPSHFAAARGAYVIRPYREGKPRQGVVLVEGTSTTNNLIRVLGEIERAGMNVKIVAATSRELFDAEPESYRNSVLTDEERVEAMAITNRARQLMYAWITNPFAEEYWMGADWDDRWRTGGSVEEVVEEAHLSGDWLLRGIERYVRGRDARRARLTRVLES